MCVSTSQTSDTSVIFAGLPSDLHSVSSVSRIEFKSVVCIALLFLKNVIALQNTIQSYSLHLNCSSCL
jgi:hypothetical protein